MSQINAHKVLRGTTLKNGFLDNIAVPQAVTEQMRHRRDVIREHVRAGIRNWNDRIKKAELFESSPVIFGNIQPPALSPKFRMQGSQVYGTANDPAIKPPQELDLDDGFFLPVAFFEKHGASDPLVASKGLFSLVEAILLPLCQKQSWEMQTHKNSCIRVRFGDHTHYDLPLYAVSDEAYTRLVQKRLDEAVNAKDSLEIENRLDLAESFYDSFAPSDIRLAHRKHGWIDSDPRQLENWFVQKVDIHGEQLRRICRYLKAWRDYKWRDPDACKLSSIALMACAVRAYDELKGYVSPSRDDIAFKEVVARLPEYLSETIANPVPGKPDLNEDWDFQHRTDYVNKAMELRRKVNQSFETGNSQLRVLKCYELVLGGRVPEDQSLVTFELMVSKVKEYEPARTPQPNVRRSTSG